MNVKIGDVNLLTYKETDPISSGDNLGILVNIGDMGVTLEGRLYVYAEVTNDFEPTGDSIQIFVFGSQNGVDTELVYNGKQRSFGGLKAGSGFQIGMPRRALSYKFLQVVINSSADTQGKLKMYFNPVKS